MPRKGWIKLHHVLLDNPIWTAKPFDEGHAWVDLLLLAAHDAHKVDGDVWMPGTIRLSKEWLMQRWGWTRWRADKVLRKWEDLGMIQRTIQRTNQRTSYTLITVEKWGFYQGDKGKNQRTNQRTNQPQHKKYKEGGDGEGLSPRPAEKMKPVWVDDHWEVMPQ